MSGFRHLSRPWKPSAPWMRPHARPHRAAAPAFPPRHACRAPSAAWLHPKPRDPPFRPRDAPGVDECRGGTGFPSLALQEITVHRGPRREAWAAGRSGPSPARQPSAQDRAAGFNPCRAQPAPRCALAQGPPQGGQHSQGLGRGVPRSAAGRQLAAVITVSITRRVLKSNAAFIATDRTWSAASHLLTPEKYERQWRHPKGK